MGNTWHDINMKSCFILKKDNDVTRVYNPFCVVWVRTSLDAKLGNVRCSFSLQFYHSIIQVILKIYSGILKKIKRQVVLYGLNKREPGFHWKLRLPILCEAVPYTGNDMNVSFIIIGAFINAGGQIWNHQVFLRLWGYNSSLQRVQYLGKSNNGK